MLPVAVVLVTGVGRLIEHVPRSSRYLVTRPRLHALLDSGSPLTVLRAPVGFGKTTLVVQWIAEQERSTQVVGWVRVRPGTDDAIAFWTDTLAVLADAGLRTRRWLPNNAQELAAAVERVIASSDVPVLLVLDRFENIDVPNLDQAILDVLRHTSQLRLIASGHSHRHFPAHSYLDIDATVIEPRDLLFTSDETAQLMDTIGVELPRSCVERIHASSGGWPEPLRAFALVARQTTAEADLASAAQKIATDYLRRRLLSEPDSADRVEFALATSVPDEFSLEVAQLLTDDPAANAQLDWLTEQGLLLVEGCGPSRTYRWPAAARQALLAELQRRDRGRVDELHARLGRWYLAVAQQPGPALEHAVQSRNWLLVVKVIDAFWRELLFAHPDQLFAALAAAPLDVVSTSGRALALRDDRIRVPDDRLLSLAALPASPDQVADVASSDGVADLLDTGYTVLAALRRRGLFERAQTYGDRLLDVAVHARTLRPADVAVQYPAIQLGVGLTRMAADDIKGALEPLRLAHEFAADHTYTASNAAAKLALAHAFLGEPHDAARWLERHDSAPLAETWLAPRTRLPAVAARWLMAIDRLDRDEAARIHREWPEVERTDELWGYYHYIHAQYALNAGMASGMLDEFDRARSAFRSWLGPGAAAVAMLDAAEVDLLLALGRGNLARAVLSGPCAEHPLLRVARARLALLAGHSTAALRLASDSSWDRKATERHRLDMQLIRAIAAYRCGDLSSATAALCRAIDMMRATGSLRALVTVPREDLLALAVHLPMSGEFLAQPAVLAQRELFPPRIALIILTEREQRVLEKLAAGLTTRQAANSLVVSVNTVKTQQASLYRKLGTNSRADAIARAQQLGLISAVHQPDDVTRARAGH
ncbi:MAG: LuxR family transcriptional regulator, maltose regulon positive regulatory protein [Pseudonocardiales bacterium]|nr:LuxR family transcriptional regulator, maltose regulon positive regulatory protein [Pseudonocardiales bacterium]